MPKGRNSKTHAYPERMTLTAQCQCGVIFEGLARKTNRLFDLHRSKCLLAAEKGELLLGAAEMDSKGNLVLSRSTKRQSKLARAVKPFMDVRHETLQECLAGLG